MSGPVRMSWEWSACKSPLTKLKIKGSRASTHFHITDPSSLPVGSVLYRSCRLDYIRYAANRRQGATNRTKWETKETSAGSMGTRVMVCKFLLKYIGASPELAGLLDCIGACREVGKTHRDGRPNPVWSNFHQRGKGRRPQDLCPEISRAIIREAEGGRTRGDCFRNATSVSPYTVAFGSLLGLHCYYTLLFSPRRRCRPSVQPITVARAAAASVDAYIEWPLVPQFGRPLCCPDIYILVSLLLPVPFVLFFPPSFRSDQKIGAWWDSSAPARTQSSAVIQLLIFRHPCLARSRTHICNTKNWAPHSFDS